MSESQAKKLTAIGKLGLGSIHSMEKLFPAPGKILFISIENIDGKNDFFEYFLRYFRCIFDTQACFVNRWS